MSAIPPLSGETTLVNEARVYTYEYAAIVTPNSDTPSKRTGTDPTKRPPSKSVNLRSKIRVKSGAKIRRALGAAGGAGTGEIPADQACNWELEGGCLPRPGASGVAAKEGGRFFKPRAVRIYRRETAPTSLVPGRLWGQSANNGLGGGGAAQQPSLSLPVHRIIIC